MQGNIYLGISVIILVSLVAFIYQITHEEINHVGNIVHSETAFEGFNQGCLVTLEDGTKEFIHGSNCLTARVGDAVYHKKSPFVTGYFVRSKVLK